MIAGSMTLASNSLTAAGKGLTGVASPVIVQVPTVSAVHTVTLPAPSLPGSAVTAVGAAVAKQELRQQQQQSQQQVLLHQAAGGVSIWGCQWGAVKPLSFLFVPQWILLTRGTTYTQPGV